MDELIHKLLAHLPEIGLVFAVSAFAMAGAIFAFLLKPRIERFDQLLENHTKLQERIAALKIDDNLRDLQNLKTDVALLKQSEEQRDKKVRDATDSLSKSLKDLEVRISQAVKAGDNDNLHLFLTLREDQAETAYTLSKIQGGTKEEDARNEWLRAKEELARFAEEEKRRSESLTASGS